MIGLSQLTAHPRCFIDVSVAGASVNNKLRPRLVQLTHTDNRGFEADTLEIEIDDSDGQMAIPPRGAEITLSFGWQAEGLVYKGKYTVDEIQHRGAPDTLTIRARSADLRTGLTTQKERSWHNTTVGKIVAQIAGENGLAPAIHASLAPIEVKHLDQTHENSANLLTRLAIQHDAIATVKNGQLIFTPMAGAVSVGGQIIQPVTIERQSGDNHNFQLADRQTYTGVRALYHDVDGAVKGEVLWGGAEGGSEQKVTASKPVKPKKDAKGRVIDIGTDNGFEHSADNIKTLRHVYASKASAKHAARAEWRRLQRGMANFSITLAKGIPELFPETPATVVGFKPQIDSTDWIIIKVVNVIDANGGYLQTLEMEIKATEIPD